MRRFHCKDRVMHALLTVALAALLLRFRHNLVK